MKKANVNVPESAGNVVSISEGKIRGFKTQPLKDKAQPNKLNGLEL